MVNIWLVFIWTIIMCFVSAVSFFIIYRKLNASVGSRKSILEQAENELLDELRQIDFDEFEQTESGRQLLGLLLQENPHLLNQVTSQQNRKKAASTPQMKVDEDRISASTVISSFPFEINAEIAQTIVKTIQDLAQWQKKRASIIATLIGQVHDMGITFKKAEILRKQAEVDHELDMLIASASPSKELDRLILESEKMRIELQNRKIELALDILTNIAPDLSASERNAYATKIIPTMNQLVRLEMEQDVQLLLDGMDDIIPTDKALAKKDPRRK